ncbi:MAG TPA: long-chain-fatty-acid--CoA ligase [Jatrophihabitans sp.]|jgi:acyl-CoA synthetase (AMP-forming)/AMP-acid ligase II|uniref:long-chain-fatty-acid--CoA ligase n=1 Tax=Jatrophihabitans sp. TaxID=1932789 RepID=UPI002E00D586|nr:long-chain-fatty-acid--CoA ligase [Jatrophihabitans sp.]
MSTATSPHHLPCGGAHWVDHVARHAHADPDGVALRFEGATTTWAGFDERVRRFARGLHERGVTPGDRVVVLMTNRPEFIEAVLAANAAGAIAVPVNFRLAPEEAGYILSDSGASVIVTDTVLAPLAAAASAAAVRAGAGRPRIIVAGPDPSAGGAEAESYDAVVAAAGAERVEVAIGEHDVALIMYTSGTTGLPKGAMLTHLNLLMQSITGIRTSTVHSDDAVVLLNVPMFHIAGIGSMLSALLIGATSVIMPTAPFDALSTLDVVEHEGITSLFLVPAQWQVLCADPAATDRGRSLRTISWGAAPATVSLLETMGRVFPYAEIISVFGQTEMSPVTTSLPAEDAVRKIGSVGKAVPTIAARIVDDEMNDVAPGQVGEIVYRGPSLMAGYWNNPQATADAFDGGWFHSGDLVRADEEGFLYVVDRKKDMIISGGENIYCAEVENAIAGCPAVADVAVIGAKHERWGETPVAFVVPADPAAPPTIDDLTAWTKDRLASYKKPTAIVVLAELPRNASGKVRKHELRASYGSVPLT